MDPPAVYELGIKTISLVGLVDIEEGHVGEAAALPLDVQHIEVSGDCVAEGHEIIDWGDHDRKGAKVAVTAFYGVKVSHGRSQIVKGDGVKVEGGWGIIKGDESNVWVEGGVGASPRVLCV